MVALLGASDAEVLPALSASLAGPVAHTWAGALVAGQVRTVGGGGDDTPPSFTELAILAERTTPGIPWYGRATLAGVTRAALAISSAQPLATGDVLVLADAPDDPEAHAVAQQLWEVAVVCWKALASSDRGESPLYLAAGRFAAGEHAKQLLALKDAHAATLTAVLAALRSRRLDAASAREVAVGIASSALTDLRSAPVAGEHSAGQTFALLAERLRALIRHTGISLELASPDRSDRLLPPQVSDAAQALVRGCVLVMLENTAASRIRVGWEVEAEHMRVSVRDDGDGARFPQALAEYRLRERLVALGGSYTVDTVSGWGTTVTADFPLALPPPVDIDALAGLSRRELHVLAELARGRSNQQIAERLHITEHTVKFHVANILSKLGVRSRGQAAAMARDARI
ncbi:helix-turn-helix transcriptional regulator [Streptomyces canus]|uniref:helix-turn-helix transcriptional regulator n=1 Tax=Streptomyces canus TaxID=58343 RepID=UPI002B1DFB24|nr:LuxR C-terminal-related transcriptional regulator [Streptomyces canus]